MIRIDIFSAKGGVGKTTVAYRLARICARKSGNSVLLVDADLTGTCFGDLVEPWVTTLWRQQMNLIQLVYGCPEALPEHLAQDTLPVYELRVAPPVGDNIGSCRASNATKPGTVLFCPSHPDTSIQINGKNHLVKLAVLQALLGHESAGGWVRYVIEQVVTATDTLVPQGLGFVIVDHGPGIGALQWAELIAIEEEYETAEEKGRPPTRRALFVASRDGVDLAAAKALNERITHDEMTHLAAQATWVLNRLPSEWEAKGESAWRSLLDSDLSHLPSGPTYTAGWYKSAIPLFENRATADAYAQSSLAQFLDNENDEQILRIHERLTFSARVKS